MKKNPLALLLFFFLIISGYSFYNSSNQPKVTPLSYKMEYKGMNLVAPIKDLKNSTFESLVENNVNAISLIPYAFVDIDQASISYNHEQQWWGETSKGIRASIQKSHEYNMKVMLKPHLWINHNFYTGNLDFPTEKEWKHWEADYEKYILDFAKLAEEEKIELFCFGTELENPIAKRPQYWTQLIQKIKKIYSGKLTYAANWDSFETIPFWNALDYIGIDAYFPLSAADTPSIAVLNESWKKHIVKMQIVQQKINKKILFTEFGYRNSNKAAEAPWTETETKINDLAQANGYEALFQSFSKQKWYAGGFAWKWYADDYYKKKHIDYTPQEKPALEILKKWYN
jgi:hypothetical protein